ncbi:MAG: hypothetical protein WB760_15475 [Xanthobacteraceae bacterium]
MHRAALPGGRRWLLYGVNFPEGGTLSRFLVDTLRSTESATRIGFNKKSS